MFHRTDKKIKAAHTKPLNELVEVLKPAELLDCPKRQDLMKKLSASCLLEPARYDGICVKLIHTIISYCQHLPETANSYYSLPGGLIDHALNRTEAAMSLYRQYMLPKDTSAITDDQALWSYALFCASLLKDIGKLQVDYSVDLYDTNGQLLTHWNPLLESMISVGSYYHYEFMDNHEPAFKNALNTMFAKILMPSSGFAWIASNLRVLKAWLGLLDDNDGAGSGTLKAILSRADDIALQRELSALLLKIQKEAQIGGRGNRLGTFVDVPTNSRDAKRATGIKFIRWVQKELSLGNIIINKGPLLVVKGGMVMSETMYKLFVKSHPEYKRWQIIQSGFISLGAHKISLDGSVVLRNDLDDKKDMENGIMLEKSTLLLPDEVQMADLSTGKISTISAMEVAHSMYANITEPDATPALSFPTSENLATQNTSDELHTPSGSARGG